MTFWGNLHDLHDMQAAAEEDILAKWRESSVWDARETDFLDDPEDKDLDCRLQEFQEQTNQAWDRLWGDVLDATERVESKWWSQLAYDEFLASDYWQSVRKAVFARDGHQCKLCKSTENLQVHHRWYPARGTELKHLDALVLLCSNCHHKQHQ